MANEYIVNSADLTAVAEAIRTKGGTSDALTFPGGFVEAVGAILEGTGGGLAYDMGEFVLTEETTGKTTTNSPVIAHNLGAAPDFILVWTDDLTGTAAAEDKTDNVGFIYMRRLMNLPQRITNSGTSGLEQAITVNLTREKGFTTERITVVAPTSTSYLYDEFLRTETGFRLPVTGSASSNVWRAGITYRYFCASAWWLIEEASE